MLCAADLLGGDHTLAEMARTLALLIAACVAMGFGILIGIASFRAI
jgi:hypothetical protein